MILIGIVSGIVSGLGMGGGALLIIFLTLIFKIEQHVAQASNLIFFIPTSIIAVLMNIKNKNINIKLAIYVSIFGAIGALIGAKMAMITNAKFLKKYFGIFLSLITIHEIYTILKEYKILKKRKNNKKRKEDVK